MRLSCEALAASRIRSSSSRMVFSYSSTISSTRSRRASVEWVLARRASSCITSRSREMISFIPGRSTLTTTSVPSFSVAACTCAIEAAASGCVSKVAKDSVTGLPSDFSMMVRAVALSNGGTRSWSFASSMAISGGSRSRRVESACPSLMKMGPSSSSASRRRSARGASLRRSSQVQGEARNTKRSGR